MKKLYSLILLSLPLLSFAQPTIQASDEPVINLMWASAVDPNYSAAIPAGGSNVTWDYSTLQWVDTGGAHFLDVEGTPYQTTFPNATLAVHDSLKDEWIYFRTASNGLFIDGIDSAGINLIFNPSLMYVPVPFTYGNSVAHRARFQIDTVYMGFPGRIIRTYDDYFDGDGWGTLQLPTGNITNTLRVKTRELITDTAMIDIGFGLMLAPGYPQSSQGHYYRWYQDNGPDAFLLELRADSLGSTATRSEYQVVHIISVPEISNATLSTTLFPNPSRDVIHIDFGTEPATGNIEIYNSIGEIVRVSNFAAVNQYTMYVNTFSNGLYHFSVKTSENKIKTGTFVVNH
jgi:hypothetical protein